MRNCKFVNVLFVKEAEKELGVKWTSLHNILQQVIKRIFILQQALLVWAFFCVWGGDWVWGRRGVNDKKIHDIFMVFNRALSGLMPTSQTVISSMC